MRRCLAAFAFCFASLPIGSSAATVKAYVCRFTEHSVLVSRGPAWQKQALGKEPLDLIFAALNPAKGRAQLIGSAGAVDVFLSFGEAAMTFIELLPTGGSTVTTVYFDEGTSKSRAAHSRHTGGLIVPPIVTQMVGECEARY